MVHGNPTWSFFFRALIAGLRGEYRVVAMDHVGCGLSDRPPDRDYDYSLRRRVEDLERLLDSLDLTRGLTLVVHDWGGMIGMAYAVRHPERVKRLVVLNTAAFHMPREKRLPWSLWLCRLPVLGPLLVRGLNAFCRGAVRYCSVKGLSPETKNAYLSPYNSWKNRIAVLRFVQDIPLRPGHPSYRLVSEVEEGLDRLRPIPMLICWGGRDFVFDETFLAQWRKRFPEAEVHHFAEAGHFVLEDAGPEVLNAVRDFLHRHRS
jgi:haloalkane dehalogenase